MSMDNPRRIYYYDDDEGLDYIQFPYTYEHYHAFEGYDVGANRGWHPDRWEGYNEGAYRGGWNDDLQVGARRREQRRAGPGPNRSQRPEEYGPHAGKGPRNFVRADARIMDDVVYRLTLHGQVNASHIGVNVQDGVVILSGTVPNRQQKRLAEDTADSVSGVKDVDNRLRIEA